MGNVYKIFMTNPIDGAFQKKKREGDSSEICAVARYIPVSGYVSCFFIVVIYPALFSSFNSWIPISKHELAV